MRPDRFVFGATLLVQLAAGALACAACSGEGDITGQADAAPESGADTSLGRRDAGELAFCRTIDASNVQFCADFDDISAEHFGFDVAGASEHGVLTLARREVDDASYALDMAISQEDGAHEGILAYKLLSGDAVYSEMQLDFYLEASPSISKAGLAGLGVVSDGNVGLSVYHGTELSRSSGLTTSVEAAQHWHHAVLAISHDGDASTSVLEIDNIRIESGGGSGAQPAMSLFEVGIAEVAPNAGTIHAQFDNIVVRRLPRREK